VEPVCPHRKRTGPEAQGAEGHWVQSADSIIASLVNFTGAKGEQEERVTMGLGFR
jgi:hypothetical protein